MSGSGGNVSIGSEPGSELPARAQSNEPAHPDPASKTLGEGSGSRPGSDAGRYGEEGTNKTLPQPKPDNKPSEQLGHAPHIPKSPYTRG
jgi:hypothetical protein